METLNEILDEAKKAIGKPEDSELAKVLGVQKSAVSNWRNRGTAPDTYALMQLQKILKKDARELLAIIEAERAKDEKRREYWQDVKKSFRSTTATALAAIALFFSIGQPNKAEAAESYSHLSISMYIMSSWKRIKAAYRRWREKRPFDLATA